MLEETLEDRIRERTCCEAFPDCPTAPAFHRFFDVHSAYEAVRRHPSGKGAKVSFRNAGPTGDCTGEDQPPCWRLHVEVVRHDATGIGEHTMTIVCAPWCLKVPGDPPVKLWSCQIVDARDGHQFGDFEMTEFESTVRAMLHYARGRMKIGRVEQAARLLKEASRCAGGCAILHADIGRVYADLGLFEEALASFEHGRKLDPDDPRIAQDQAWTLRRIGRQIEAVTVLREAIARTPTYQSLHPTLGCILEDLGRIEEAKATYEAGEARCGRGMRQPRGALLGRLCQLERRRGRLQAALDYAVRGMEATPTNAELCRVACELALARDNAEVFRALYPCLLRRGTDEDRVWVQEKLNAMGS
jgi:Tfp pilus assembly protein PilF